MLEGDKHQLHDSNVPFQLIVNFVFIIVTCVLAGSNIIGINIRAILDDCKLFYRVILIQNNLQCLLCQLSLV
jgi:hypothetical protein